MTGSSPVGQRFGGWTVLARAERRRHHAMWQCRCTCGTVRAVLEYDLRRGVSASCGCLGYAKTTRHGYARRNARRSPTYQSWCHMLHRVRRPDLPRYGGRGVRVDPRWHDFTAFLADMGERPPGTSIDRIDNNGHYEPGNCRWATRLEQAANRDPAYYAKLSAAGRGRSFSPAHRANLRAAWTRWRVRQSAPEEKSP